MTKKLSSVKSSGLKFRSLDTVACVIKQVAIFWLSSCATSTDKILEKVEKSDSSKDIKQEKEKYFVASIAEENVSKNQFFIFLRQ